MSENFQDTRANLYHLARTTDNPDTARQIWSAVDGIEARSANDHRQQALSWPHNDEDDKPRHGPRSSPEYRDAFDRYIRRGDSALGDEERRALSADNDASAGAVILPEQTSEKVILAVNNTVVMRQLATRIDVIGAQSIGVPVVDVNPADADWTVELQTGSEDTAMKTGKRELCPWPVAKRIKSTLKLLQRSRNAEKVIGERLSYVCSLTFEKAYLSGDGAHKPLGVFTPSSEGVPASRDIATGNTTTSITGDGLSNALYSLKERYLSSPALRWLFHRDAVKQIRQLKDATTGIYYFEPGLAGQPDRILGVPVMFSEFAPNTFTASQYVGIIGDFSQYWVADADAISIQRLNELYIVNGQVGFIARFESDGAPALGEAFARVKLAAE